MVRSLLSLDFNQETKTAGANPRRTMHPARRPVALAALDSDGDGKLELVVANQDSDELSLIDGDAP